MIRLVSKPLSGSRPLSFTRSLLLSLTLLIIGGILGIEPAPGQEARNAEKAVALVGGRVLTATGTEFDPGTVVMQGGKLVAVGARDAVAVPAGAEVIDVSGRVIIPGLVDTHSHLGVYSRPNVRGNSDGNEMTGPVQGIVRAIDSINVNDPGIRMANAGGVTTANIMPGSGNVIGGQTVYVKLRGGSLERMLIEPDGVLGGLKMANGENPKRSYGSQGKAPKTRMKVTALQRSEFIKARDYQQKWNRYRQQQADGDKDAKQPDRDLALEPLVEVLEGRRTVHFHTHRADDILTVLRLRDEFGFELLIQHGTEAYKVIDQIARHGVPISMTVIDSPGGKAEVVDLIEECGAELSRAGVPVIVNTDDPVTESRFFLRTAAIPVRGGMQPLDALQAITLRPAEAMHLAHRVGSLEAGKDADVVVLSGEPFSVYTRVLQTYIDGELVFDIARDDDVRYQSGGFALSQPSLLPAPAQIMQPAAPVEAPAAPAGAASVTAADTDFAVLAGRLHTVSQGTISDGVVIVRGGRIAAVGPRNDVPIPADLPVLAAAEATPGLIDTHSVVPLSGEYNIPGDQDADESTDPNQADTRTLDAFNPSEPLLRFLLEQGVTVIHACPGRANVIAGATGVFRTSGAAADEMVVRFPYAMLFNLGESPKTTYDNGKPATRMGTAAIIREALNKAANERRNAEQKDEPIVDLKSAALASLLAGEMRALFCAQRSDDLQTALRLSREFQLKPVLALGAEAYQLRRELAEQNVPVIVHPTMQRIGSLETYHTILGNAGILSDAGVQVAIGSGVEGYVPKTRIIRGEAAMAMVYGLGYQRALKSITLDAARILGIENDYGSLEVGKVADLVLYDADPFEHATHVTHVVLGGKLVHDRSTQPRLSVARRMLINADILPCCAGW